MSTSPTAILVDVGENFDFVTLLVVNLLCLSFL